MFRVFGQDSSEALKIKALVAYALRSALIGGMLYENF